MPEYFDHEKLHVYQASIEFIGWAGELLEGIQRSISVKDHLDRASTSIALNIAEGNGKFSAKERSHFFSIARGSALECAACLDVFVARHTLHPNTVEPGKKKLHDIVNMLMGLINALANRIQEEPIEYTLSPNE